MRRFRLSLVWASALSTLLASGPVDGQAISFSGAAWYPTGATPYDLALDDFDGDGILDAVTVDFAADSLTVRRGDGIGGSGPRRGARRPRPGGRREAGRAPPSSRPRPSAG